MKRHDLACLIALAGLWGASYLFMRIGAQEFGAFTLAGARAAGAAVLLLPLVAARRDGALGILCRHWRPVLLVGITNSALPYVLFAVAALSINAGLSAIFNAATPMYAALIGMLWFSEQVNRSQAAGLALGFAGVTWLAWDNAGFKPGGGTLATTWAILACVAATMLYAFSAHYSKRFLAQVPPLALAAGSQLASALVLALPALALAPVQMPSAAAWLSLLGLSVACTALAYVLFFRLIARVGASRTMAVPFLVPAFGVLWGVLFLGETFSREMLFGTGLIVTGTALAAGLLTPEAALRPPRQPAASPPKKAGTEG